MKPSDKEFLIVAFTLPSFFEGEPRRITEILQNNEAQIMHIRKPEASAEEIFDLLKEIPRDLHCKIKLHDHFELLDEFNLYGVHLNSRNSHVKQGVTSVSKSLHSLEELSEADKYDYVTLSPIYDSISKKGYKSAYGHSELAIAIEGINNVIALGGITPKKIPELKSMGFKGAAMLSYFWNKQK